MSRFKVGDRVRVVNCGVYEQEGIDDGSMGEVQEFVEPVQENWLLVTMDWIDGEPVGTWMYHVNELELVS